MLGCGEEGEKFNLSPYWSVSWHGFFFHNSLLMNINEKSIARCSLVGIFNKVLERSDLRMTYLLTDKYRILK